MSDDRDDIIARLEAAEAALLAERHLREQAETELATWKEWAERRKGDIDRLAERCAREQDLREQAEQAREHVYAQIRREVGGWRGILPDMGEQGGRILDIVCDRLIAILGGPVQHTANNRGSS